MTLDEVRASLARGQPLFAVRDATCTRTGRGSGRPPVLHALLADGSAACRPGAVMLDAEGASSSVTHGAICGRPACRSAWRDRPKTAAPIDDLRKT